MPGRRGYGRTWTSTVKFPLAIPEDQRNKAFGPGLVFVEDTLRQTILPARLWLSAVIRQFSSMGGCMKSKLMRIVTSGALLAALVFSLSALGAANAAQPAAKPAAAAQGPGQRRGGGERHPEIRMAINALERAKKHLQEVAHDFGGHRAEALEAVNRAIEQLKLALRYDKD